MNYLVSTLLLCQGFSLAIGGFAPPVIRAERPVVNAGELGYLEGITKATVEGGKDIHYFRNIKFGDIQQRFAQPTLNKDQKGTEQDPYDASRWGPQCLQGSESSEQIDIVMNMTISDAIEMYLVEEQGMNPSIAGPAADVVVHVAEEVFEVELVNKTVAEAAREYFDVDYSMADLDCLQLAVSTPLNPTGQNLSDAKLPVMFFVYGGGYSGGTQLKMDQARLGDAEDIVLVTVNYRVGPLGFFSLDSDLAAGNMGMLDMVTGLEWVQEYIHHFGGDPDQVTVFGESAGAASIGHLVLSDLTEGLFNKGIGQSGSALSPWAFDANAHFNGRNMAGLANCTGTDDVVAQCMIDLDYDILHSAYRDYKKQLRLAGYHGYQGAIPGPQTKGAKKFYEEFERPHQIMESQSYRNLTIMFGANSHEGSYVYGVIYKDYIEPNGLEFDEDFFKYEMVRQVQETVGIDQSFDFDRQIEEYYFRKEDMGSMEKMAYGILDLLSVEFLKASSYEMVVENSKRMPSFFYSHEHVSTKSMYNVMYFADLPPYIDEPGVCHADELMMLFNLNLPVVLCNLNYLGAGLGKHAQICASDLGVELPELPGPEPGIPELVIFIKNLFTDVHDVAKCLFEHDSAFKVEYGECIFGSLTEAELETSHMMTKAWTNFAKYGTPTPDVKNSALPILQPWDETQPEYIAFKNDGTVIDSDYKLTYNKVALDHQGGDGGSTANPDETTTQGGNGTTTTTTTSSNTTSGTPGAVTASTALLASIAALVVTFA